MKAVSSSCCCSWHFSTSCVNHVHGATDAPEATLALWKDVVFTDMLGESIKNDTGYYFAWDREQ